mgnify:CR=1 FL=1
MLLRPATHPVTDMVTVTIWFVWCPFLAATGEAQNGPVTPVWTFDFMNLKPLSFQSLATFVAILRCCEIYAFLRYRIRYRIGHMLPKSTLVQAAIYYSVTHLLTCDLSPKSTLDHNMAVDVIAHHLID